jgi:hypothetical protein
MMNLLGILAFGSIVAATDTLLSCEMGHLLELAPMAADGTLKLLANFVHSLTTLYGDKFTVGTIKGLTISNKEYDVREMC